jgi:hypothetical protein
MRLSVFALLAALTVSTACVIGACSSDSDPSDTPGGPDATTEGGPGPDGSDSDGAAVDGGRDGAKKDGDTDTDGAIPDDGGVLDGGDPPSVQLVGRFEKDGAFDKFAFPSSKVVVRFKGADAVMKLTQTDGFSVGHSWFNVVVDGVLQPKIEVNGASVDYAVATNLDPNMAHTVEIEKRTEANLGVVRLEGVTFPGGGVLLGPPVRPARRIEFLSDSTIDGFGVEGDRNDVNSCAGGTAPPELNNARKSMAALTAATLSAEQYLIAYSGKGLTKNNSPADPLLFPTLYDRALPDSAGSAWGFAWKPDAVVISLGGVDFDGLIAEPAGFSAAYGGLVDKIRASYPNAWIFLTVWSQIKDDTIPTRTAIRNSLQGIVAARAADLKLSVFQFPTANVGTDETGCQYHANETHSANMAALLSAEIKTKLGW